jgi:hypothetical protein
MDKILSHASEVSRKKRALGSSDERSDAMKPAGHLERNPGLFIARQPTRNASAAVSRNHLPLGVA